MMFDAKKKELKFDNGRVVPCEDINEYREICHQLVGYAKLLGHISESKAARAVPCGVLRGNVGEQRKKKVRISIDRTVIKNDLV